MKTDHVMLCHHKPLQSLISSILIYSIYYSIQINMMDTDTNMFVDISLSFSKH